MRNIFKKITIGSFKSTIIIGLISISFMLMLGKNLKEEAIRNIVEVNIQVEARILTYMKANIDKLYNISDYINYTIEKEGKNYSEDKLLETFTKENNKYLFDRVCIANKDGYLNYGDGTVYVGDRDYFNASINGKSYITKPKISRIDEKESVIYSVPLVIKGRIEGVLVGSSLYEDIKLSLKQSIYSEDGKEYIIDNKGNIIVGNDKDQYLIKKLYEDTRNYENIKDIRLNQNANVKQWKFNGDSIYLYYDDIDLANDWYLVSIIPIDKVFSNSNTIIYLSLITIIIVTTLHILSNYYRYKKNKIKLDTANYIDSLTNIRNSKKFKLDSQRELKSYKGIDKYVLVSLDINKLKFVNDIFGYSEGDKLIKYISEKLINLNFENIHGRISNDVFAIMFRINNIKNLDKYITYIYNHIINSYIKDSLNNANDFDLNISIGVYIIQNNKEEIEKILDNANLARLESKKNDNKLYYVYDEILENRIKQEQTVQNDLKHGLESGEFKILYQPKVDVSTEKIVGAEALIRWIHKKKGFISPSVFIPIAEKNGDINLIGKWVLEKVCKDLQEQKLKNQNIVPISINLSRVELYQPDLIIFIKNTIEKYNIESRLIEIEITETAALNDVEYINRKIAMIKRLGIKVSMDDFGTGMSTLSNLKLIDIDILKIDRSILLDLESDNKSRQLVKSIIELAKKFDFKVVCEGVENIKQVEILRVFNCDMIQGFVYFRPLEITDFTKELNK